MTTLPAFMIVAFLLNPVDDFDAYVVSDPGFDTLAECVDHAEKNGYAIGYQVIQKTGAESIRAMYCLPKNVIEKYFGGALEA